MDSVADIARLSKLDNHDIDDRETNEL